MSAKTSKGHLIKKAEFILNKGKATEKLLKWHYKSGYMSEDSSDPTVKQDRAVR